MKHYKVNVMESGESEEHPGFGPKHISLLGPYIDTNQYVIWTRLNDKRYKSFIRIQKGDILHILKSKSSNNPIYYQGEVLSDLIIDEDYQFSKNILHWEWEKMNKEHHGKKEMKYIIYWKKQPYPDDELYQKINQGYNAQTVKEIKL